MDRSGFEAPFPDRSHRSILEYAITRTNDVRIVNSAAFVDHELDGYGAAAPIGPRGCGILGRDLNFGTRLSVEMNRCNGFRSNVANANHVAGTNHGWNGG